MTISQEVIIQIDEFFERGKTEKLLDLYGWGDTGRGYLVHPSLPKNRIQVTTQGISHIKSDMDRQNIHHKGVLDYLKGLHPSTFRKLSKGAHA
jgi:hypothetical protein